MLFVSTLTASDANIKATRAANLGELASIEASTLVQNLKREKLALENRIANMTDLAPDTTYSLKPGGDTFDAAKWVKDLHRASMDLKLKNIELEVAQGIYNEWFGSENA